MTKLEKLYAGIKNFKDAGMTLNEENLKEINRLEEQLIKDEVLPALKEDIEPLLSKIQRELVLVVEHKPGQPLSVSISRESNVSQLIQAKKIELDPEVEHSTHDMTAESLHHKPASKLRVSFPDGTVLQEKNAVETFVAFVKKVGVERVRSVVVQQNLKFCRVPVISNRRDSKYGNSQKDLGNGWLLITHSNNKMKKSFIEKVSDALNLHVKVQLNNDPH